MEKYLNAKQIALGLKPRKTAVLPESSPFKVENLRVNSEMHTQFLEKTITAPEQVIRMKDTLSLFDEYKDDQKSALKKIVALSEICRAGDKSAVKVFLEENPAADWLSFVFINDRQINEYFYETIEAFPAPVKQVLLDHLQHQLARLVDLKALFERLTEKLKA